MSDPVNLLSLFEQMDDSHEPRETYKRGPLNYTGSKRETLDDILALLPYKNTWVDVFGGSGVVTLARRPCKLDVFNDRNSGICDFFRACQSEPDRLIELIELMPHSREMFIRSKVVSSTDYVVRGAQWYYLVQCSFGGRAQAFGRVLKGKNTILSKLYGNLELFPSVHRRFKQVTVENLDWRECFRDYDSYETVFYADPPYYESDIYDHGVDHKALCDTIFELNGFVALSGFDNELYNSYDWDGKHVFEMKNRVATTANPGTPRNEVRLECLYIKEAGSP